MRRFLNTSSLVLLAVLTGLPSFGQIKEALAQPDTLIHQEIGDALADDYAGVPYGKGHVLFFLTAAEAPLPLAIRKRTSLLHVRSYCV